MAADTLSLRLRGVARLYVLAEGPIEHAERRERAGVTIHKLDSARARLGAGQNKPVLGGAGRKNRRRNSAGGATGVCEIDLIPNGGEGIGQRNVDATPVDVE